MHPIPLILTRPAASNLAFREAMSPRLLSKFAVIESPLVRIVPVPQDEVADDTAVAIFSSSNGVRFAPRGNGRMAYCVGQKTTEVARAAGWAAQYAGPTAEVLLNTVKSLPLTAPVTHFSGVHMRVDIAGKLVEAGHDVRRVALYEQQQLPMSSEAREAISSQNPVIVLLFSPRTAAHFAAEAPQNPSLQALCLSAAVAAEIEKNQFFNTVIANEPTAAAMMTELEKIPVDMAWVERPDRQE